MKKYYRIMLGKAGINFQQCYKNNLIGINFDFKDDFSNETISELKEFNQKYIPLHQKLTNTTSSVSSGLACAKIWEIRFGMNKGDIILTPDGNGNYFIGEIVSDYFFNANFCVSHCRQIKWLGFINKYNLSSNLKNSMGATHTIISITKFKEELDDILINLKDIETNITDETKKVDHSENKVLLYEITDKSLNWKKLRVYNDFNDMQLVYELIDCEEYTYVMFDRAHDTIKIGKTKNDPEQRLAQLRTANPSITLQHTFPSSLFPEKDLHIRFSDYLKDLEWFFNTKGLQKFLSDEQDKHRRLIESYKKRVELDKLETEIYDALKFELEDTKN